LEPGEPVKNISRGFRLWEKKRGDRRTGSHLAASFGEGIFFGVLFLLGSISLTVLITTRVIDPGTELFRVGFGFWLLILVLASFILLGGAGMFYTVLHAGASAERRSAMVKRAATIDLIRNALPSAHDYPSIPRDGQLTDSPGVTLTYRLPIVKSLAWQLLAITLLCLTLTGFATVLVVVALDSLIRGDPVGFLMAFALPYVAASGWSIYYFLTRLWVFSRIGPTCVEISDLPLHPGHEYEIFLSQAGRFSLQWLRMNLICEEEATFHQGTDIRIETREVCRQQVFRREAMRVAPGRPLEIEGVLRVPRRAMHTFRSAHNVVRWKLEVSGKPSAWPTFERVFPVIIYPEGNGVHCADAVGTTERAKANDGAANQFADSER